MAGREDIFFGLATPNVEILNEVKPKRIVTTCPHCLHTLKNEYPAFGGNYEVIHHTQLIDELFLREFDNPWLRQLNDQARFEAPPGRLVVATDREPDFALLHGVEIEREGGRVAGAFEDAAVEIDPATTTKATPLQRAEWRVLAEDLAAAELTTTSSASVLVVERTGHLAALRLE